MYHSTFSAEFLKLSVWRVRRALPSERLEYLKLMIFMRHREFPFSRKFFPPVLDSSNFGRIFFTFVLYIIFLFSPVFFFLAGFEYIHMATCGTHNVVAKRIWPTKVCCCTSYWCDLEIFFLVFFIFMTGLLKYSLFLLCHDDRGSMRHRVLLNELA